MVDKKIDTSKLALFAPSSQATKRAPSFTIKTQTRRGKNVQQEAAGGKKNEIYSLGDYIGGYVISAIEEKKVVLDYYGEKVTLNLHEGKEAAKGDYTPIEVSSPPPPLRSRPLPRLQHLQAFEAESTGAAGAEKGKAGDGG